MCDLNPHGECCFARSETDIEAAERLWMRWLEGSVERAKRWAVSPAFRWDSSPHSNVWELPNGSKREGPG
jgi:hypothetical protein